MSETYTYVVFMSAECIRQSVILVWKFMLLRHISMNAGNFSIHLISLDSSL